LNISQGLRDFQLLMQTRFANQSSIAAKARNFVLEKRFAEDDVLLVV